MCTHSAYNSDGWLGIQVNVLGGKDGSAPPFETLHPFGFISRPPDPAVDANGEPTEGCKAAVAYDGDEGFVLPLTHQVTIAQLPQLQKGDAQIYSTSGAFHRVGADATIKSMTTDTGVPAGRTIYDELGPTGWELVTPWCRIQAGELGVHIVHSSGARLDLGAMSAPGVPASIASMASLSAGMVEINGSLVSIGTDGGVTAETANLGLALFFDALVAAIGTITSGTPGATAMAPILSQLPALHQLIANIGKIA